MDYVYDTSGQPITQLYRLINENTESSVTVIRFRAPSAGYKLAAGANSLVTVLARRTGPGGGWQNIAASPIDLTPYANQIVDFDVKAVAGAVNVPLSSQAVQIRITPNP